jgi:hypothetical protein
MLGTEANVRLLRVLALAGTPLGAGELSHRAQLGRTGIYPALAGLESAGIIEFVGAGSTRQVELRMAHPLAPPIAALFQAEAERIESMVAELRRMFANVSKLVTSAWLENNQDRTTSQDDPDMMTCYVVGDPRSLHRVIDLIEDDLYEIERVFQVHFELVPLSRSEVSVRVRGESLDDVILLAGVPPNGLLDHENKRAIRNQLMHGDHDTRTLLMAQAVAAKLRRDPSIVKRVRANIDARMSNASEQERRELKEWSRIVSTMSPSKLQRFLVDNTERAVRLRQSLPALGLLTAQEREEILAGHLESQMPHSKTRTR